MKTFVLVLLAAGLALAASPPAAADGPFDTVCIPEDPDCGCVTATSGPVGCVEQLHPCYQDGRYTC